MFCPNCSHAISADGTRYCSQCGLQIENLRNFVDSDGKVFDQDNLSARRKGIKQGAKLIASSLIMIPAVILLSALFPANDRLIESSPSTTWFEQIGWAIVWTTFLAGLARCAFALLFTEKNSKTKTASDNGEDNISIEQKRGNFLNPQGDKNALPPRRETTISDFGKWKITDELFEPVFVKPKQSGELK